MKEFVMKPRSKNNIVNGLISVAIVMVVAVVGWIIWSQLFQFILKGIAGPALNTINADLKSAFLLNAVEGTFFWMIIASWVWFTLDLGNYGKYAKTTKQPVAGLRYLGLSMLVGFIAFMVFVGFHSISWAPFKFNILFSPQTDVEAALAIKGWGAVNFFALSVILTQIPIVSLFNKYPFSKYAKDSKFAIGFGALALSLVFAMLNWNSFILPSFVQLQTAVNVGAEEVILAATQQPLGTWNAALAWAQLFVFFFLLPAEGGEGYPQKLITDKQPWSGIVGFAIALVASLVALPVLTKVLTPLATSLEMDPSLVVASFVLTIINVMLTWHHHFYDYPTSDQMGLGARIAARAAIVLVIGSILAVVWLKFYTLIPFGGNNLGLGHPMLGLMGGQFVYMMPMLIMNTYFDKWPNARSVEK